jgi:hypothetical protein
MNPDLDFNFSNLSNKESKFKIIKQGKLIEDKDIKKVVSRMSLAAM